MVWVKCTTSAKCKSIRIAKSSVMDSWNGHYLAQCQFGFQRMFFCKEEEKGAGRSTQRVLPWHVDGSEYLEGTAEEREWSCLIDHRCSWKINEFPPSLELLLKMVL
jgi:hypothetical protein